MSTQRQKGRTRKTAVKKAAAGSRRTLSRAVVEAIDASNYLRLRAGAGSDHRFIAVWPIVVDGRVFVRSWTLKPDGWYRMFLNDPIGVIQVGERQVAVRARPAQGKKISDAIERGYADKYRTPGSIKYVRGFRTARRRAATIEFLPR
jgi:hypothetical protein